MAKPFATCCLLSHEKAQHVEEAILTLVGNARYPLELIVHDDGSTEAGVRDFLRACVESGTISTLIENPPGHSQGPGVALNRMFRLAAGDPIVKLDTNLIFMPEWLKTAVKTIERNHEPDRTGCPHGQCPKPEPCWRDCEEREPLIGALGLFRGANYTESFIRTHDCWEEVADFNSAAMVIPRLAWELCGPFDESRVGQRDFMEKITETEGWACGLPTTRWSGQTTGLRLAELSTTVVESPEPQPLKSGPRLVGATL